MMKLEIERLRQAVELVRETAGVEAAMIAQFPVDLAISTVVMGPFHKQKAKDLLRRRLERYRAKPLPASSTVH
jgi:hypothetical protein